MPQANVYTTATAQAWYTDKARISTGTNSVSYNVDIVYPTATGNIFSNAAIVPPNSFEDVFVGVGNKLTVIGGNCTIQELGTATSGQVSVQQTGSFLPAWSS
jgi:hypothetical protein